jgi:bla regulator protein blaR1
VTSLSLDGLNRLGLGWAEVMAAVTVQAAVLGLLAAIVSWLLHRSSPGVRHGLWLIVAFKLVMMPLWTWPIARPALWQASVPPRDARIAQVASSGLGPDRLERDPRGSDGPGVTSHAATSSVARFSWSWPLSWQAAIMLVWLAVIGWQIARIVRAGRALGKCLREAEPLEDPRWTLALSTLARQVGLKRAPRALMADVATSPFVCGMVHPTLVVPRGLIETLSDDQRRPVLLHELAHLRRGDLLWGWLPELARIVLWFHPVAHWAARRAWLERELACDGLAMQLAGSTPASYARTLVEVVSRTSTLTAPSSRTAMVGSLTWAPRSGSERGGQTGTSTPVPAWSGSQSHRMT